MLEIGSAILDAVSRVKAANPAARYCCDPVIGDVGSGIYVRPDVVEFMQALDAFHERAYEAAQGGRDSAANHYLEPGNRWNPMIDAI